MPQRFRYELQSTMARRRLALGIPQLLLAELTQVPLPTYRRIELGERAPSPHELARITCALDWLEVGAREARSRVEQLMQGSGQETAAPLAHSARERGVRELALT